MPFVTEPAECPCHKRPNSTQMLAKYRVSRVPVVKSHSHNTTSAYHDHMNALIAAKVRIQQDMIRTRRLLMIEGQRGLAKFLSGYMNQQVEAVISHVEQRAKAAAAPMSKAEADDCPICGQRYVSQCRCSNHTLEALAKGHGRRCANGHRWSRTAKGELISIPSAVMRKEASIDINVPQASAWRQAIEAIFGDQADAELRSAYTPAVQSVAAKAHARTSLFLGQEPPKDAPLQTLRRAQDLAQDVTSINDTTRDRLSDVIGQAIDDGMTVAEVAQQIRDEFPKIASNRIPTIARTEVGKAVDEGTKQAILESSTVSHVSVVGCQAIEPNIPTFEGIPTCNISDVPAVSVDDLEFHINHTGAIIVSHFVGEGFVGGPTQGAGDDS